MPGNHPFESLGMTPEGEAYVRWFHESNVWKNMTWHGIRTLKLPSDIWNYQEIIFERRIDHVIETGTRHGGSAVFFAETLAARRARGPVVSIDVDRASRQIAACEGVHFLVGDSAGPAIVEQALALLPAGRGPLFLILDSDHSRDHVLRELRAWVPKLRKDDYLVVEDTIVNGHPVRPGHGPGPMEAIAEYLEEAPGLLVHDAGREAKFGATFAARGHYVRA
ncbi:MAG TPA: CmcI family methyltransferase [Usitatibacter sp.]|nr:CmcI family methyltransferase [Usitatibacter sp.]